MKNQTNNYRVEDQLDQYVRGRLDQDQIDQLWVEMMEEPSYFEYLKTSVALKAVYQEKAITKEITPSVPVTPIHQKSSSNFRNWSIAAGVALTLGIGSLLVYQSADTTSAFSIPETLEFAVYRSAAEVTENEEQRALQSAVNLAVQGDNTSAIILLNQIIAETQSESLRIEALLNLGIIEYNSNDFAAAERTFQRASSVDTSDSILKERAYWNLAQAQIAVGNLSEARKTIEMVIDIDGAHSRMAQNYMKYLR